MSEPIRIMLVDDHAVLRSGVRLLLERVVVTTSEFSPSFRIRERFLAAARALEEEPR